MSSTLLHHCCTIVDRLQLTMVSKHGYRSIAWKRPFIATTKLLSVLNKIILKKYKWIIIRLLFVIVSLINSVAYLLFYSSNTLYVSNVLAALVSMEKTLIKFFSITIFLARLKIWVPLQKPHFLDNSCIRFQFFCRPCHN